jgi:hypothetical protein
MLPPDCTFRRTWQRAVKDDGTFLETLQTFATELLGACGGRSEHAEPPLQSSFRVGVFPLRTTVSDRRKGRGNDDVRFTLA